MDEIRDWERPSDHDLLPNDDARAAGSAEGATLPVQPEPGRAGRRRRRKLPRVATGAAALILAGGSGTYLLADSSPEKVPAAAPSPIPSQDSGYDETVKALNRQLEVLADRRDSGIDKKDQRAFLAGLDRANKDLVSEQKVIYKNLTALSLIRHDFDLGRVILPQPEDKNNLSGDWSLGSAYVTERVQLGDVDQQASEAGYDWQLTLDRGTLVITDISASSDRGSYAPAPWDGAALTIVRTEHMLVAATPDAAKRANEVADAAEAAYSRSTRHWKKGHPTEFVIFATAKPSTFRRWYGSDDKLGEDRAVAKTLAVPSCCSPARAVLRDETATRITLDTSRHRTRIELEWTIAHELTHAVAQPASPLGADRYVWADEGYAEWVGVQMLESRGYLANWASVARKAAQKSSFKNRLPADKTFYGKNAEANYAFSERFFEFLASRYGTTKIRDFYFYLNAMKTPDADTAMRKYFKAPEKSLVAAWASWVR